ncbi:hypothetical protein CRYUN_Cryun18bG0110000 [Craigia yunnanensis]
MAAIFTLPRPTPSLYFPKYHQKEEVQVLYFNNSSRVEGNEKDHEELATVVMGIVDLVVHKTHQIFEMEQEGQLDEGFPCRSQRTIMTITHFSNFQAKEDGDKPGLEAMLQKVLQLYASTVLLKHSYAKKGNEVLKADQFLETMIKAPEQEWNKLFIDGLAVGKGEISLEDFYAVIKKQIERTLIQTEGGSYQQHVLTEDLKGIQSRAEEIVQLLQCLNKSEN